MKKLIGLIAIVMLLGSVSCTEQSRTKTLGGTMTINLPQNQKMVEATWKGDDLWYLTRPMRIGEKVEIYTFKEESSFGMMEGTVIFKEHK